MPAPEPRTIEKWNGKEMLFLVEQAFNLWGGMKGELALKRLLRSLEYTGLP